jgi:hypothetical protein
LIGMEKPNLNVFSGTLVSIDGGRQLAIARNLRRLYEDVLHEPLPCPLRDRASRGKPRQPLESLLS